MVVEDLYYLDGMWSHGDGEGNPKLEIANGKIKLMLILKMVHEKMHLTYLWIKQS